MEFWRLAVRYATIVDVRRLKVNYLTILGFLYQFDVSYFVDIRVCTGG